MNGAAGGGSDPAAVPQDHRGRGTLRASWLGTGAFAVAAVAAVVSEAAVAPLVVLSLVLFVVGIGAFLAAYLRAIARSRYEAIGMGGLFFLAGSAPPAVRRSLLLSLAVEVVVALVAASIRIYTPVAFGLLVPMYGLGLAGWWGATHGTFPPRATERSGGD